MTKTYIVFNQQEDEVGYIQYGDGEYEFISENDGLPEYSHWSTESEFEAATKHQLVEFLEQLEGKGFVVEVI